jgi:hypothetical protein
MNANQKRLAAWLESRGWKIEAVPANPGRIVATNAPDECEGALAHILWMCAAIEADKEMQKAGSVRSGPALYLGHDAAKRAGFKYPAGALMVAALNMGATFVAIFDKKAQAGDAPIAYKADGTTWAAGQERETLPELLEQCRQLYLEHNDIELVAASNRRPAAVDQRKISDHADPEPEQRKISSHKARELAMQALWELGDKQQRLAALGFNIEIDLRPDRELGWYSVWRLERPDGTHTTNRGSFREFTQDVEKELAEASQALAELAEPDEDEDALPPYDTGALPPTIDKELRTAAEQAKAQLALTFDEAGRQIQIKMPNEDRPDGWLRTKTSATTEISAALHASAWLALQLEHPGHHLPPRVAYTVQQARQDGIEVEAKPLENTKATYWSWRVPPREQYMTNPKAIAAEIKEARRRLQFNIDPEQIATEIAEHRNK